MEQVVVNGHRASYGPMSPGPSQAAERIEPYAAALSEPFDPRVIAG